MMGQADEEWLMRASFVLSGGYMRNLRRFLATVAAVLVVGGQALAYSTHSTSGDPEWTEAEIEAEFEDEYAADPVCFPDPFESANRRTLAFNRGLDRWFLTPITSVYRFVVPRLARQSIRRFLVNLDSPVVFTNDVLQRQWSDAGVTVGRFGINTTVGLAGFFDPATRIGLEGHISDFGQTLAIEGVPSGPYVMLPLLGPTTVRDGVGDLVDVLFRPVTFFLGPVNQLVFSSIYGSGSGLTSWDEHSDEIAMLEQSSVDFYAALRNAYFQTRSAEIWDRRSDHASIKAVAMDYLPEWSPASELHALLR